MTTPTDGASSWSALDGNVEPNTGIPKTIGALNIIFASLLLLCGVCSGLYTAMQSAIWTMAAKQMPRVQKAIEAQREFELRKLEEQEAAAPNAEAKAALQAQQQALKEQPLSKAPDIGKIVTPAMIIYGATDLTTGIVLNVLLLISGIGLLGLNEWGRVVALWSAGLKLIRLVTLYGYFAVVAAPAMAQQIAGVFEEMIKNQPPGADGPGPEEIAEAARFIGFMFSGGAIMMMVAGAIYPTIVLILLTRSSAKAACAARQRQVS